MLNVSQCKSCRKAMSVPSRTADLLSLGVGCLRANKSIGEIPLRPATLADEEWQSAFNVAISVESNNSILGE